jgi:hypothetical protein
MTNWDLFELCNFVLRKNGRSEPVTPERFLLMLKQENLSYFKQLVPLYSQDQKVADSLSPFEVLEDATDLNPTTTTLDVPTDYSHFVGMYYTDDDGNVRAFDLVTDEQWDRRLGSTITIPSDDYPICKIVGDKIYTSPVMEEVVFADWFLPSENELGAMYTNLHLYGVGGFANDIYTSSRERNATERWNKNFVTGMSTNSAKSGNNYTRACRSFTSSVVYSLRDVGPAGGLIFYVDGTTYYEAAPSDQSTAKAWSNVTNVAIGTTSANIGEGQNNTNEIIAQVGHIDSAAKLCKDLIIIKS